MRRFGITALLLAIPYAYDALRFAGAAYLLWLAWQALRPGGQSPFRVHQLPADGRQAVRHGPGGLTNLLNPKIAMLYVSLLPQFIDPAQGSVLTQALVLGVTQTAISVSVNALIAVTAAHRARCSPRCLAHGHRPASRQVALERGGRDVGWVRPEGP